MSDPRFQNVTSRQAHLKAAASSLTSGLGASPAGMSSYKITFYKQGDREGRFPAYSVQVPKQVAEMLARPGGFQSLKIESSGSTKPSQSFHVVKTPPDIWL